MAKPEELKVIEQTFIGTAKDISDTFKDILERVRNDLDKVLQQLYEINQSLKLMKPQSLLATSNPVDAASQKTFEALEGINKELINKNQNLRDLQQTMTLLHSQNPSVKNKIAIIDHLNKSDKYDEDLQKIQKELNKQTILTSQLPDKSKAQAQNIKGKLDQNLKILMEVNKTIKDEYLQEQKLTQTPAQEKIEKTEQTQQIKKRL